MTSTSVKLRKQPQPNSSIISTIEAHSAHSNNTIPIHRCNLLTKGTHCSCGDVAWVAAIFPHPTIWVSSPGSGFLSAMMPYCLLEGASKIMRPKSPSTSNVLPGRKAE